MAIAWVLSNADHVFSHDRFGVPFYSADVPAGSLVVVTCLVSAAVGIDPVVTDSWDHEYTQVGSRQTWSGGSAGTTAVFWTITKRDMKTWDRVWVYWPGGSVAARIEVYSGVTGLIDTSHQTDQTFPQSQPNSGPVTIPATETLLLGLHQWYSTRTPTPTSGWTERVAAFEAFGTWDLWAEDKIVTGGAGSYSSAPALSIDDYWSSDLLAFSGGTPPDPGETIVTASLTADDQDGSCWYEAAFVGEWPPASTFHDTPGDTAYIAKGPSYSNNMLARYQADAVIPAGAIIVAARWVFWLRINPDLGGGLFLLVQADHYDFGAEPCVAADWSFECLPSVLREVAHGTLRGGWNAIPFADYGGISRSGVTPMRFALEDPGAHPDGNVALNVSTHEETSVAVASYLEIAYTLPTFRQRAVMY